MDEYEMNELSKQGIFGGNEPWNLSFLNNVFVLSCKHKSISF